MSDTPLPPATGDSAPIDAEFEPAAPKSKKTKPDKRSGPGWTAFGGVTLISLVSLAIAAAASGFIPGLSKGEDQIEPLKTELAALKVEENLNREAIAKLNKDVERANELQRQVRTYRAEVDQRLNDLEGALGVLETDLAALPTSEVAPVAVTKENESSTEEIIAETDPSDNVQTADFEARFTALEDQLAGLALSATQSDDMPLPLNDELEAIEADITALKERLDAVETELAETPDPIEMRNNANEQAALALSAIEAAARRGRPFVAAHQRLETALPGNAAVARLEPLSTEAVATLADLRRDFPDLTSEALAADPAGNSGASGWMRSIFGDGVTVRREGETVLKDQLDEAAKQLQAGDLGRTIDQIEALDPAVQTVFTDWLDNARKRQTLEDTLEALRLTMISKDRP